MLLAVARILGRNVECRASEEVVHFRQHRLLSARRDRFLVLAHLQLFGAQEIIFFLRHRGFGGRIAQNLRMQKYHQILLQVIVAAVAEQIAD